MTDERFSDKQTEQNNNILVSAIITTHDRDPAMVLRAVNSVLDQTYPNIELIVVDDSSPSFAQRETVERSVRSLSEDILYLKHEVCQGACAARNTGLRHAKGYYVGFLDDDDEWMPTKIEEQLKGFSDDEIALVYNPVVIFNEKGGRRFIWKNRGETGYVFESLLKTCFFGSTSNPLIRKACIEAVGGFDVQMQSAQDYDLWLRLALKYPVGYVDKPLLKYYIHSGERISADAKKKIQGYERIIHKYEAYIDRDDDTWYRRHRSLIPFYLKQYGRKKALALYISCVKKRPGRFLSNFVLLCRIIMGNDLYMAINDRFAAE